MLIVWAEALSPLPAPQFCLQFANPGQVFVMPSPAKIVNLSSELDSGWQEGQLIFAEMKRRFLGVAKCRQSGRR